MAPETTSKSLSSISVLVNLTALLRITKQITISFSPSSSFSGILETASENNNLLEFAIINSKKNGSVSSIMRENIFDYISYPRSLFVDYIKIPSRADSPT